MAAAKKLQEPSVISLHLIRSALDAVDVEEAAAGALVRPPVALPAATSLRLSFRNLLKIQSLDVLRSLTHLQLDNNNITVIEGLECLSGTLEWLDLSFNAIESMAGLSALTRLTDLSLFNNRITAVAGIDECPALQCVSLGNNLVEDLLGTVLFFRRLAALEVLTLEGNPLCRQGAGGRDMYRPYVFAFIPKLKYLDYNFITATDRLTAREGGVPSEKLVEVEEADAAAALALKKERETAEQLADYVAANLEVIETIVADIFSDGGSEDQGASPSRGARASPPPPPPSHTQLTHTHPAQTGRGSKPCPRCPTSSSRCGSSSSRSSTSCARREWTRTRKSATRPPSSPRRSRRWWRRRTRARRRRLTSGTRPLRRRGARGQRRWRRAAARRSPRRRPRWRRCACSARSLFRTR